LIIVGGLLLVCSLATSQSHSSQFIDNEGLYDSLLNLIYDYPDSALAEAEKMHVASIGNGDSQLMAYSFLLRAGACLTNQQTGMASDYFDKALKQFQNTADSAGMSSTYNGMGVLSIDLGNVSDAIFFYKKALSHEPGDNVTRSNLARAFAYADQLDRTDSLIKVGLSDADPNDSNGYYSIYEVQADINYFTEKYDDAIEIIEKCYSYERRKGDRLSQASLSYYLCDLYFRKGEIDTAIVLLNQGKAIEEELERKYFKDYYYIMVEWIYTELGDYEKAYDGISWLNHLQNKRKSGDNSGVAAVIKADLKYQTRIKGLKIRQQLEKESYEEKLRQERKSRLMLYLIIALFVALFGVILVLYTRTKKLNARVIGINESLREQNEIKEKLIGVVSHDLRSPLTSIAGALDLISDEDTDEETKQMLLTKLTQTTGRAISESEKIITWVRGQLSATTVNIESVDVRELIDEAIHNTQIQFFGKQLQFKNETRQGLTLNTDKGMLGYVLKNLLNNAAKFSHKGGQISVRAVENATSCKFYVKDNGVGMSPVQLAKLFKTDISSTKGTGNEKGTGLGLVQCFEFVEKLNGKIHAESEEGAGSTFHFEFPG